MVLRRGMLLDDALQSLAADLFNFDPVEHRLDAFTLVVDGEYLDGALGEVATLILPAGLRDAIRQSDRHLAPVRDPLRVPATG
jgi:hypothetical protein